MYNNGPHQYEESTDSLDEFLAKLFADISEFLPSVPSSSSALPSPPYPSTSAPSPTLATYSTPSPQATCQWVSPTHPTFICGGPLPSDPKHIYTHFRQAHDIRGNEKVIIPCHWRDCQVPPMQRGSLIRHVLSVHLGLLRWRCGVCGKVFSRKGTVHACAGDG